MEHQHNPVSSIDVSKSKQEELGIYDTMLLCPK